MASYASYKKIINDNLCSGVITCNALQSGAGAAFGVQWVFNNRGLCCQQCANAGGCCEQANGCCCLWTVPANVGYVTFELWGGGGGGPGQTCCNCCSFATGGAGGMYASKSTCVCPGWTYTICAGGTWPCNQSHTCGAPGGCVTYVCGCNLNNLCVYGGCGGLMCNGDAWGLYSTAYGCANCTPGGGCGWWGADLGFAGSMGSNVGNGYCHCARQGGFTGSAPLIGLWQGTSNHETWCACGCYTNWPSGGGSPGRSSYCGDHAKQCAGGSGQGGSGLVKITFM